MSQEKTFEINLARLETIVSALESPGLSLEEGMNLYKEGIKCAQVCSEKLQKAKHELEIWQKETGLITSVTNEIPNENSEQTLSQKNQIADDDFNETINISYNAQNLNSKKSEISKQINSTRFNDDDFDISL